MPETATYLYCVVRSPKRPSAARLPDGIPKGERPSLVALGGQLWLVVSQVPLDVYGPEKLDTALRDLDWVSTVAVAHESVVEHFTRAAGTAVVPMKLFTMFSSVERAVSEMQGRRAELAQVLERIAGCEEWGIRVTRLPASQVTASSAGVRRITSGAAFLAAKKAVRDQTQEASRLAAQAAEDAFAALAAVAREARRRDDVPPAAKTPPLLDAAFLVPARRRARFHGVAEKLARTCASAGVEMIVSGPWPAYNFILAPEAETTP